MRNLKQLAILLSLVRRIYSRRLKAWLGVVLATNILLTLIEFALIAILGLAIKSGSPSLAPLLACLVGRVLLGVWSNHASAQLGSIGRAEVQLNLWRSTLTKTGFDVGQARPSKFIRVLNQAPTDLSAGVLLPGSALLADVVSLSTIALAGMFYRPELVVPAIGASVLVSAMAMLIVTRKTAPASKVEAYELEISHRTSWDVTNGVRDILINRATRGFDRRARQDAARLERATHRFLIWSGAQRTLLDTVTLVVLACVAVFGSNGGVAFVGAAILLRLMPLIARLGANASVMSNASARIIEWIDVLGLVARTPTTPANSASPTSPFAVTSEGRPVVHLHIEADGSRVRKTVDMVIRRGEWIQIMGPSGAGKSSVLDCIAGLWRPEAAEQQTDVATEGLGYATQSPFIMSGTILENIVLGRAITDQAVTCAGEVAGLEQAFGEGWKDRRLTDRGTDISGGQRQRISLARAIASSPRLLLLDEATANLDIESEHLILGRLHAALPQTAVVIVTHRTPTVNWPLRLVTM